MRAYRYRKPYRVKRRKSVLRSRFFWLGFLVLIIIGGISYFLFFSGVFQIKKVVISGGQEPLREKIESLLPDGNIFLIDSQEIREEILSNFSQVAEVEISRDFPDSLNILAIERLPVALWCELDSCFFLDNKAVIFGEAQPDSDLLKIRGIKEMLNKEKIAQILEIRERLKESLGITISQAFLASQDQERLNIKTSEGWEIYFNLAGDLDWQLQEIVLVLEKEISPARKKRLEYIDLRFSRVFYK